MNEGREEFEKWWDENKTICGGEDWSKRMVAGDAWHSAWVMRQSEVDEIDRIGFAMSAELESLREEIADLKWQRDQFEKAAKDWMADYDKLREKYEGPYIIGPSVTTPIINICYKKDLPDEI